jgi:hypothetical protein
VRDPAARAFTSIAELIGEQRRNLKPARGAAL